MKKLIASFIILCTLACSAQTATSFVLTPNCKQTVKSTDTAVVFAQLTASDGYGSIGWQVVSCTTAPIMSTPLVSYQTGIQAVSSMQLYGLVPGTYVLRATGKSTGGTTGSALDSLIVVSPPPPPKPRSVTIATVMIFGIPIIVPSGALTLKYDDGSTITQ